MTDLLLGIFCAAAGGVLGIAGIAMAVLGLSSFVAGIHGGWFASSMISLFGAGLGFVGVYCARYGVQLILDFNDRKRKSAQ